MLDQIATAFGTTTVIALSSIKKTSMKEGLSTSRNYSLWHFGLDIDWTGLDDLSNLIWTEDFNDLLLNWLSINVEEHLNRQLLVQWNHLAAKDLEPPCDGGDTGTTIGLPQCGYHLITMIYHLIHLIMRNHHLLAYQLFTLFSVRLILLIMEKKIALHLPSFRTVDGEHPTSLIIWNSKWRTSTYFILQRLRLFMKECVLIPWRQLERNRFGERRG